MQKNRAGKKSKCIENHITMMNFRKAGCTLKDVWIPKIDGKNWQMLAEARTRNGLKHFKSCECGEVALNARGQWGGALLIKAIFNLSDCAVVESLSENPYLQYFLGFKHFQTELPFDASLMTYFRKRLPAEVINRFNEKIIELARKDSLSQIRRRKARKSRILTPRSQNRKMPARFWWMRLAPRQISDGFEFGQWCPGTDRKYHRPSFTTAAESHASSVYQVANISPEIPWNHQTSWMRCCQTVQRIAFSTERRPSKCWTWNSFVRTKVWTSDESG